MKESTKVLLLEKLASLDNDLQVSKVRDQGGDYNRGWTNGKKFALSRVRDFIEKQTIEEER